MPDTVVLENQHKLIDKPEKSFSAKLQETFDKHTKAVEKLL